MTGSGEICAKLVQNCVQGRVRNHLGFQSQVKDFDCYSKNNGKCFKGFQQDDHRSNLDFRKNSECCVKTQ